MSEERPPEQVPDARAAVQRRWWVAGIANPESVAEHSFRCAVIGYYLSHLEDVDSYKVLVMTLFNDIHEARINDLHKMGHYYIDFKEAEKMFQFFSINVACSALGSWSPKRCMLPSGNCTVNASWRSLSNSFNELRAAVGALAGISKRDAELDKLLVFII